MRVILGIRDQKKKTPSKSSEETSRPRELFNLCSETVLHRTSRPCPILVDADGEMFPKGDIRRKHGKREAKRGCPLGIFPPPHAFKTSS